MAGRRASLALVLAAIASACAAQRPPSLPSSAISRHGRVHAVEPDTARRVAAWIDDVAPRVVAMLPDADLDSIDVYVRPSLPGAIGGVTYHVGGQCWIELREDRLDESGERTLAHELVHAALHDGWDPLPGVVEEGLCDLVADTVVERDEVERLRTYFVIRRLGDPEFVLSEPGLCVSCIGDTVTGCSGPSVAYVFDRADVDATGSPREALERAPPTEPTARAENLRSTLDAVGRLVAELVGPDELRGLCARAAHDRLSRVPSAWLLTAAGLSGAHFADWCDAAERFCGRQDRARFAARELARR